MEFIKTLKEKDNRKALYAALIFMMLLTLFFLLVSMDEPDPPLKEKQVEVEIEFGSPPMGGSSSNSAQESTVPNTVTESAKEIDTQEESSVHVPSGEGTSSTSQNTEEEKPKPDDAFTFPSNSGNGNGDGNGDGDGFGNGDGLGGNGPGPHSTGSGTSNPDRKIIYKGKIDAQTELEGKIALELWVDENGKVVRTKFNESRSTSGSSTLKTLAKKWAETMKYEKIPGAPIQYVGTQVFTFIKQ